jgi:hypothetical protein
MKKLPYQSRKRRRSTKESAPHLVTGALGLIARAAQHHIADFSTLRDLIEHENRTSHPTHVLVTKSDVRIYYPAGLGKYEESRAWHESGYWHSQAPKDRKVVVGLPRGAEEVDAYLARSSGHTTGAREAFGRRTQWPDWIILDSIDKGNAISPEAERRAIKLAQLGFIDTTGTWRLTTKGRQVVNQRVPVAAEARARGHTRRIRTPPTSIAVATELSRRVGGSAPKPIGAHRWSDSNESTTFVTRSPECGQPVVVLISVFADGTLAQDFFSSESLSELDRYENIVHFLYSTVDYGELQADLQWVWETVDRYAASWQQNGDVDESRRRRSVHRPPSPARRRIRRTR